MPEQETPEKFAPNLHLSFSGVALNDIKYLIERETGFEPAITSVCTRESASRKFAIILVSILCQSVVQGPDL